MFRKNFMLKLAQMLMQFGEIETNKGKLTYEGDLQEGTEVFIEREGELVPAEDGDYEVLNEMGEGKIYQVRDGKVESIVEVEVEEDPQEGAAPEDDLAEDPIDPEKEELKNRVAELEALLAERDARIAELEAMLSEKEEQLQMWVAKPAHKEIKDIIVSNKENKALKYFK